MSQVDFEELIAKDLDWASGQGDEKDVVITTRIRLARNLEGFNFPGWTDKKEQQKILEKCQTVFKKIPELKKAHYLNLSELSVTQKQLLVERHLVSREQVSRSKGSAVVINDSQSLSLMINEEDHFRIQSILSGLALEEAYENLNQIDNSLVTQLPIAYDEKLGFLTACPSNLGTGLRASVMLHLPGLVLNETLSQVITGINTLGFAVRGFYGEGTEALGHLFQVSNQSTLGEDEVTILQKLQKIIKEIASHERRAREKFRKQNFLILEDQISRAYAVLRYAKLMSSKEALEYLSMLKLAAEIKEFPESFIKVYGSLLLKIQPAHLQREFKSTLDIAQRDKYRAEILSLQLKKFDKSARINL